MPRCVADQWFGIAGAAGGGIGLFGAAVLGFCELGALLCEPIVPVLVPGWLGPDVIVGSLALDGKVGFAVGEVVIGAPGVLSIELGVVVGVLASWLQAVAPAASASENKSDLCKAMIISDTIEDVGGNASHVPRGFAAHAP
jgi:hypothetical protein